MPDMLARVVTHHGTYWRSALDAEQLRARLRGLGPDGFAKQANLGGGGDEKQFEQTFSSLAYTYLKDAAPRLMDYVIGFQLVERNEDDTKALGVFGFRVSNQWLYAPVFFLNGDLKGHELLYLKDEDLFVPLRENWVNSLLSHKPQSLGEASGPNQLRQIGSLSPDIRAMSVPPSMGLGKRGCDEWARRALPLLAAGMRGTGRFLYRELPAGSPEIDLRKVAADGFAAVFADLNVSLAPLLTGSLGALRAAHRLATDWPLLKQGFDRFHGRGCFFRWGSEIYSRLLREKTAQEFDLIPDPPRGPYSPRLALDPPRPVRLRIDVLDGPFGKVADDLSAEERERLLRDGVLVRDDRDPDQVSKAYETVVEQQLTNPDETGVYQVLQKPARFERMLVVHHPHTHTGRMQGCTVVSLEGSPRAWGNFRSRGVFVDQNRADEAEPRDYAAWFEGLESASPAEGGWYVAVDERGSGTVPFQVRESHADDGYWMVDLQVDAREPSDTYPTSADYNYEPPYEYVSPWHVKLVRPEVERAGSAIVARGDEIRIPRHFKFLKIKDPPEPKDGVGCGCIAVGTSDPPPVVPGTIDDVQILLREKTAHLRLDDLGGSDVLLRLDGRRETLSKSAAFAALIRDVGLDEPTARHLLRQVDSRGSARCRVVPAPAFGEKRAAGPWDLQWGGPSAPVPEEPYFASEDVGPRRSVNTQYPDEQFLGVEDLDSGANYDPDAHDIWQNYEADDFRNSVQRAQQAVQDGQREVFDTSVMGGLLKQVRQDSVIDRYLGPLMKAMDRLGRLLFLFYWHKEEWEDRYGSQDLPEIEDAMRNTFEGLGDTVHYLREKTVQVGMGSRLGEPDLDDTAGN